MSDTQELMIVFKGNTQSIDQALKSMGSGFASLEKSAEGAATGEHKAAGAAAEVEREAKGMTRGVEVAADALALMSKESAEATRRLYEVRSLATDMRGAFSNMGAAIAGGMSAFAGVAAVGFISDSAKEAMASEGAWTQLGAAIGHTGQKLEDVKRQIEDGRSAWEKYRVSQAEVAAMTARGLGMGLSTKTILGDPKALADTAVLLGEKIPQALDQIGRERGAQRVFSRLGLNQYQQQMLMGQTLAMNSDQRAQFVLQQVEMSRFAGAADAAANSATGKFGTFNTALKDLKDEVGTGVIPALTELATTLTGALQGADALARPFGGLANVLKTSIVPLTGLALALFTPLRGVFISIVDLLLGRLTGALGQTATSLGDADTQAKTFADDLHSIPETVNTVATFHIADAVAVKEPYIANVLSVPEIAPTTAVFHATAAEAAIAREEAQIAAIPKTVTTTASVGVGTLPAIAITAAATVTTYAVASGALKPVTDAIGNLTATVGHWVVAKFNQTIDATGHIIKWTEARVPEIRVVGDMYKVLEHSIPAVRLVGDIVRWVQGHTPPHVKTEADVTRIHVPRHTSIHVGGDATVNTITVPKGQQIHIGGTATVSSIQVPAGTQVHIATPVTVSRIIVPKGTSVHLGGDATIDGVRVRPGQHVTIHGTGEIDGLTVKRGVSVRVHDGTAEIDHVQLRKGATVDVSGGKATIDTLYAKGVKMNLGSLGPGFTMQHPVPYYIQYKTVGPNPIGKDGVIHIKIDGGGFGDFALNMGEGLTLGIVQSLILARLLKGGGTKGLGDAIRKILGKGPKPPTGGTGGGNGIYDPELDAQLKAAGDAMPNQKDGTPIPPAFQKAFSTAIMAGVAAIAPATLGHALGDKFAQALKGVNLGGMFKGIDWAGSLKAGLIAASFPVLAAAAVGTALAGGIGSIFGPASAEAASGPMKKARAQAQASFGQIAADIIGGLVKSVQDWVNHHNPFGGLKFGGNSGHGKPPHKGDVWVPTTGGGKGAPLIQGHWAGPGTGYPLPPHRHAAPLGAHVTHQTNHIHINGAQDPKAVAAEVNRNLAQLVAGTASARRLNG